MFGRTTVKWLSLLCLAALSIGWSTVVDADQSGKQIMRLPRSFQGARLGMTRNELSRVVPEVKRTSADDARHASRTVVVRMRQNPYIGRIEYRFFQEALQDLVVHYKNDRVPRGYDSLLDKMKQSYGEPAAHEDIPGYDPRVDVFSVKKTVWKDDATVIVLSEVGRLVHGEEVYDLMVMMTDLALQEASQRHEKEMRQKEELAVPVPLEAPHHHSRRSVDGRSAGSRNVSNS